MLEIFYLKEEKQKDKIITADYRCRELVFFKKDPIPSLDPSSLLIIRNSVNSHDAVQADCEFPCKFIGRARSAVKF